jgi:putative ABC transport system ATP-binding protein
MLEQICSFLTVVEEGSLHRAAARLRISQPALSRQMQALEHEIRRAIIGALDRPSAGSVSIAGERIDELSTQELAAWRAEHVGYVFQFYNLFQALTAQANVELPLLLTNLSGSERKQRAASALSMVGLSHRLRHYPKQLSGGEQQRVGIARAIVTDPTLLLCDEPTGDLDRKSGDQVLNLLEHLRAEHGKTIIMVTHDSHASARARRTVYLNKGRISPDLED